MLKVYDGSELPRTCLIRGREGEGRFGLIRKGMELSKVLRRGTKGEGEWVDTGLVYDERIAPHVARSAPGRNQPKLAPVSPPRPQSVPSGRNQPQGVKPSPNGFELTNRVVNVAILPAHFVRLVRVVTGPLGVDPDPGRAMLVNLAMTRIAAKVIEWLQAILGGKLSDLPWAKPDCTTADDCFVTDSIRELRKLFATELKKELSPEDFQAIQVRAIEMVDEP